MTVAGGELKSERVAGDAPRQSWGLIRRILPKSLHPFARGLKKRLFREGYRPEEPFCWTYPFTQVSRRRQESILEKTEALVRDGVAGDFVECGVLDGGTAALMAYAARADDRRVHLFDAWAGMPEIALQDGEGSRKWVGDIVGSPRRVRAVLGKVGANTANIVIHQGWFDDTLPVSEVERIAFLHIDCDFYEPTKLVLETFVPRMVSGGWVQIDDYTSFEGCRVAVNAFLETRPDLSLTVEDGPGGAIHFRVP
ncbi:MAG: TylF/MycF/NovP-related O-methyltransferase [Pseudomonadota bacterium]